MEVSPVPCWNFGVKNTQRSSKNVNDGQRLEETSVLMMWCWLWMTHHLEIQFVETFPDKGRASQIRKKALNAEIFLRTF